MTYEELKAEAKRQGYRLSKIQKYVPHVRCKCGARGELWYGSGSGAFIQCSNFECDTRTGHHQTERQAWINWYELNVGEWEE